MKKLFILFTAFIMTAAFGFAKDPCEGFWISVDEKTGKNTAGWEIKVVDDVLMGTITHTVGRADDELAEGTKGKGPYKDFPHPGKMSEMKTVGTYWIYNMKKDAEGKWSGGSIVDPGDGNRYKCKITFHAADGKKYKVDTLEMRGEIGMGIGRSQFWKKATEEEARTVEAE
ncbi:MAG: DUF2147 domain-containing protein [Treponema sp.]|nr:DUF2147 domain-containing protein [Treponema sp.]